MNSLHAKVLTSVSIFVFSCALAPYSTIASDGWKDRLLADSCLDCHQGESAEGGLELAKLDFSFDEQETFERWVQIWDRIDSREMPPADSGYELPAEQRAEFLKRLKARLVGHQSEQQGEQGRVRGRRLTNLQLERTLHDLLGIDIPLEREMPEEPRSEHYSTLARAQSLSHFHMEQHLKIVDLALEEAFRRALTPADEWTREMSAKEISRTRVRTREPEFIDGCAVVWSSNLAFYGRVPATTARENGWYRFEFEVDALKKPDSHGVFCTVRSGRCVSSAPLMSWVGSFEATDQPKKVVLEAWLPAGHMLEIRPGDQTLKMARFQGGQSRNGEGGAQNVPGIQIHGLTMHRIHRGANDAMIRERLFGDLEVELAPRQRGDVSFWQQAKIDPHAPEREARRLIARFAELAFRRPVNASLTQRFVETFEDARASGESFAMALRASYRSILSSSRFLFFYETPGSLDDWSLASRLSYFLWNSMPDEELLTLAKSGELTDPAVLKSQVDRMLADPKGEKFISDFAGEWLQLRDIDFTQPDRRLYRDFDLIVQNAMVDETHHYLWHLLEQNLPVSHLLRSDFTFLNERLARYYGLDVDLSDQVQRVSLEGKERMGGLLSQGAILKVTANGTTTSPVLRGVWVSSRILGRTIPPPPTNVPAIEPDIRGAKTIREQLEKHRSSPDCAGCHAKIDAPGFALENFDPTGKWREYYPSGSSKKKGPPVDASYETVDGRPFEGFAEFCDLAAANPRPLAANVLRQMLTYGTGAEISFADRVEIEKALDECEPQNYGMKSLLYAAVSSDIFRSK